MWILDFDKAVPATLQVVSMPLYVFQTGRTIDWHEATASGGPNPPLAQFYRRKSKPFRST